VLITRAYLVIGFSISALFAGAQSIYPSTINVSGSSAASGNYRFEWSIGEATSITTMTSSNLVVTSGILQSSAAYQPIPNGAKYFLPDEIKIYPNPTRDIIEINMLLAIAGKSKLELFDLQGRKLMEKQFEYYGIGGIEKWDLRMLPAGQYVLKVELINPVGGFTIKKGAFKILKIH
jgi:hypothetical protein